MKMTTADAPTGTEHLGASAHQPQPSPQVARRRQSAGALAQALWRRARPLSLRVAGAMMDGVSVALRRIPQATRYRLTDAITTPIILLSGQRMRVIEANFTTLLQAPRPVDAQGLGARQLAEASVRNYGRMAADFLAARTMRIEEALAWVEPVGEAHFADAMRDGKGVIMALPHVGSWDVAAVFAQAYGLRLTVVTESDWVTELVAGSRAEAGVTLAPRERALRALFEALKRNECAVMLSDVANAGVQTMDAPFFGRPAPFAMGPARLAVRTGAPILVVGSVRLPSGAYRVAAQAPLRPNPVLSREEAVADLTRATAAGFERIIAVFPDQWYPFHPIWPADDWEDRGARTLG